MKTYVITLSKSFLKGHDREGEPTGFKEKLLSGQKIHTIRSNFPLWEKRIKEVQQGRACISVRQWEGKPYRSKQNEVARFTKDNGVGIEPLEFLKGVLTYPSVYNRMLSKRILANNDGLSLSDWEDWFEEYDLSKELAIIHFTNFRYNKI